MTQLTPALEAALKTVDPMVFGAVAIDLPGRQVNLLDGAGAVTFGGRTYVGRDDTYGVLAAVEPLSEAMGSEAPSLRISLYPASDAAAAALAAPTMQGSRVMLFIGAVNPATGAVIADPELQFLGELDVATITVGANGRQVDYDVVSVFERFFDVDEGARLVPAFHKSIWPGELGFDFVTGVEDKVYWGVEAPVGSVVSGSGFRERWS